MTFQCNHSNSEVEDKQSWVGEVRQLTKTDTGFEAEVTGRGSSLYIIVNDYQHGKYVCIPSWQVSSELASPEDYFWNLEELARTTISIVDAVTVVTAIRKISKYLEAAVE